MGNNFAGRLDRLEASQRRRAYTGPKLTRPYEQDLYIQKDDQAHIAAAVPREGASC